jgi:hypothetical protein
MTQADFATVLFKHGFESVEEVKALRRALGDKVVDKQPERIVQ